MLSTFFAAREAAEMHARQQARRRTASTVADDASVDPSNSRVGRLRQDDLKRCPAIGRRDIDPVAVRVDDRFDDRERETRAFAAALSRGIDAVEAVEQLRQVLGRKFRDPDSRR